MFSVVAVKSRTFIPVSHIQLMTRCVGDGREHSKAASPSWRTEGAGWQYFRSTQLCWGHTLCPVLSSTVQLVWHCTWLEDGSGWLQAIQ